MAVKKTTAQKKTPAPDSVRAQILATEHWSLLAARSMTWSEVMGRITIHLAIISATLVVLALVAQVSGFGVTFRVLAIGLTSVVFILGTLTGLRVNNASIDDLFMMQGMNRLRAAYLEIDPDLEKYFVTAHTDDREGIIQSYLMGAKRSTPSHIFASTNMYMQIVNTLVAGTLGALIINTVGAGKVGTVVTGIFTALVALLCFISWAEVGRRSFHPEKIKARFPTK